MDKLPSNEDFEALVDSRLRAAQQDTKAPQQGTIDIAEVKVVPGISRIRVNWALQPGYPMGLPLVRQTTEEYNGKVVYVVVKPSAETLRGPAGTYDVKVEDEQGVEICAWSLYNCEMKNAQCVLAEKLGAMSDSVLKFSVIGHGVQGSGSVFLFIECLSDRASRRKAEG